MGGEFHVALADSELWPDVVVCYTQWTSTRRPYEERRYVPDRTARRVTVWNHDTDHATGHTECGACGGSVNPCAAFCEHCGAKFEGES